MEERRRDYGDMKEDIAVIKNNIEHIKLAISDKKDDLDEHVLQDRWLFGIMFTMQIAILTKMMGAW